MTSSIAALHHAAATAQRPDRHRCQPQRPLRHQQRQLTWLCRRSWTGSGRSIRMKDMHVPSESFGGISPERRAAQSLQTFFTFVAARIVASQLEGIGRGDLGSYNATAMITLRHFLQKKPMKDANAWLAELMREDELLGVRIMEVRAAYAKEDFEWHNLKRLALDGLAEDNTRLLREHAEKKFTSMLEQSGEESSK